MLALLLFVTLAALFLSLAWAGDYEVSPVMVIKDTAKSQLYRYLYRADREQLYLLTGRDPRKVAVTGLVIGAATGLLAAILAGGALPFLMVPLFSLGGLLLFDAWVGVDFRYWQSSLLAGAPTLVHFLPSFLGTGAVTPRRAIELTVPFLPAPLRMEMAKAVHQLGRTGRVDALEDLARKAKHPVIDAICFRLQVTWDTGTRADIFADLADQIRNVEEVAAARATAAKSGMIALLCVVGLIGAGLEFGYPAWGYFTRMMGGMFM